MMCMNITCCRGCQERTIEPNCHTTCEKYLAEVEENRRVRELVNKGKQADWYLRQSISRHGGKRRKG